jgi:hypothetical protein
MSSGFAGTTKIERPKKLKTRKLTPLLAESSSTVPRNGMRSDMRRETEIFFQDPPLSFVGEWSRKEDTLN